MPVIIIVFVFSTVLSTIGIGHTYFANESNRVKHTPKHYVWIALFPVIMVVLWGMLLR